MTEPIKKRRAANYVIWVIPLLALALAGWMLYKFYSDRGQEIVITFNDGSGLLERKTLLKYKGIVVGHVTDIRLSQEDIGKVDVTVSVPSDAIGAVAREGNEFWKVKPKVTLTEISGLETIVGGLYIEIYPAKKTFKELMKLPEKYHFIAADHKPVDHLYPGLKITLKDHKGAFAIDTPIVYRKFIVGRVIERNLLDDGVEYIVHIDDAYKNLIKSNSRFWGMESIDFKATMAGIKLKIDSIASLVAGGITFDTPECDAGDNGCNAVSGQNFELYRDEASIDYDSHLITLQATRAYNIDPELSSVYYKGVQAGRIEKVLYDPDSDTTRFQIRLKKMFYHLIARRGYFWIVEPEFSLKGISGLDAISFVCDGDTNQNSHFALHESPPKSKGLSLTLHADEVGSLRSGSGIYYEDLEAGYVDSIALEKDKKGVMLHAVITPEFAPMLNDTSLFYIRSAVVADISLSKTFIKAGSLQSMLQGGITFETPDFNTSTSRKDFTLYGDIAAAMKAHYFEEGGRKITLTSNDAKALKVGSPLYYHGFRAGEVMQLAYDETHDVVDVTLYVEKRFSDKITDKTRFFHAGGADIRVDLPKISMKVESLESLIGGAVAFDDDAMPHNDATVLYTDRDAALDRYATFTLLLERAMNLKSGSKIYYRGIVIGEVGVMSLEGDMLRAELRIERKYGDLMREDSRIALSDFKVAALLGGASLHVKPGDSEKAGSIYRLSDIMTHERELREGLRIVVSADRKSSLKVGSPLYYRQIPIGDVEQFRLSDNATQVEFSLYIEPCYAHLIRSDSRFYNAAALGMEIGLGGVKVKTETLETMIAGGIILVTPDHYGPPAETMQVFKLYDEPEEAWLTWAPVLRSSEPMCE